MGNKIILGFILIVIAITGLVSFGYVDMSSLASVGATRTNNIKTKVVDLPVVHALPFYVAKEKGYFSDEGLEIEYIKVDSPNLIVDALLSGKADITSTSGAMGIAGIAEYREPGTLEIYAVSGGDENHRNEGLMVPPNSPINSFGDLEGKKMGILPGIQWRTISTHLLSLYGLKIGEDVELIELAPGLQVSALTSGQIDALLAIEPMTTIAEKAGMKEIVSNPNLNISSPFYPGAGIVRSGFADKHPEAVEAFINALDRANKYIDQNPQESKQYLSGYTPLGDDLIPRAPIMLVKLYKDFTEKDIESIEKFHMIFTKYNVIDGEIDTRGMIYKPRN